MDKSFSAKQIFVIIAGIAYLVAFFALPYLSFLGIEISLYEISEMFKAVDQLTKSSGSQSTIFSLLIWGVPLLAILAIVFAAVNKPSSGVECLEAASGLIIILFIVALYTGKFSFGTNMKLIFAAWFLAAGSGAYFFIFASFLVGVIYAVLPGEDGTVTPDAAAGSYAAAPTTPAVVVCPSCHLSNFPDAKFCKNCGAALVQMCPKCGAVNDNDSRFCRNCGEKSKEAPKPPPVVAPSTIMVGGYEYQIDPKALGEGICADPNCKMYESLSKMYRRKGRSEYYHKNCIPE